MAKRKGNRGRGPALYETGERGLSRQWRRQRALFLPRLLRAEGSHNSLEGKEQDRAFELALRWAKLEEDGWLEEQNETSIDTQFLDQLFAEGLGYTNKTMSPAGWLLEHKFSVPGVGTADGALGRFPDKGPRVIIELKDARTDLDRDRFNGRTAVQQCWDYLNALPDCPWGIVSNFSTIRLYHKSRGVRSYEEFTLQELRDRVRFNQFYAVFERCGLVEPRLGHPPRAETLLSKTENRQSEVGEDLYKMYQLQRLRLIEHLMTRHGRPLDRAIASAQKLLDRVVFIAFCEDRGLLPPDSLDAAYRRLPAFTKATNPRWQNFLALFHHMDKGTEDGHTIPAFNGGLFAPDEEVDRLELEDDPWTQGFAGFGRYDFSEEVNVDVLGHLFERSITELEKLRTGGLLALRSGVADGPGRNGNGAARGKERDRPRMPKSAQRKRFGVYYTPPEFTGLIVERTVDALVRERFEALAAAHRVDPESRREEDAPALRSYWLACIEALKGVTVCDPACGSGAFLIRAYEALEAHYRGAVDALAGAGHPAEGLREIDDRVPDFILRHNLYGVDLSAEAVEITQLALWIRTARRGRTLADLSANIIHGNSLVSDTAVDPHALDWRRAFPSVFADGRSGGFACVIGNPPWERVKVQEREFFSITDPATAAAVSAAERRRRIEAMPRANPELHSAYLAAREKAQRMLDYARRGGLYPLTGRGDINLYMLFAELAGSIVAPDGVVGLLVPSGIATDDTTKAFFNDLMDSQRLISLYDFENREKIFPDVDGRFKFSALVFGGSARKTEQADFVFFAHSVEETSQDRRHRHITLTAADMALLNPNTRTCPIFRTRRDADLTRAIYRRVPILIDHNRRQGGNPWGIKFFTMFHQTNDAEHFAERKAWEKRKYKLQGNTFVHGKKRALPLYEAKMVQAFDHRAASVMVADENWVRQGQKAETAAVHHQNPEHRVLPRWWVAEEAVEAATEGRKREWLLAYKDITSATNERTMIAAFLPWAAAVNSAPLVFVGPDIAPRREACLSACLNSYAYDFVARQKVGGNHLNFFIVEQLPTLPPDTYSDKCPWSKRETLEHWISERVLKLSCTAEDMIPLAAACGFKGSRGDGVHVWKEQERAALRAELDAAYFILYGVEREDAVYILSTFTNTGYTPPERRLEPDQPFERGSTGEAILEAYDRLRNAS